MKKYTYKSKFVKLLIKEDDGKLVGLDITDEDYFDSSPLIDESISQLDEYFSGKRKTFDLKIEVKGTDFQKRVWDALQKIPYGETRTYQEIAEEVGSPKGQRAVGGANNKNPIMIIIPCHRVIGKNGKLVGFAGGLDVKKSLLELEQEFK